MTPRLAMACGIVAITLLGFFVFPGHTYLQSDTQIYVPMMEHICDRSIFSNDLVATRPHLSYTIYDDVAIAVRRLTGATFEASLIAQQILFRGLQVFGIYLLALAFPLAPAAALAVAAIVSLGATIAGPAVLLFEYEPVPRGYAIGLIFLAIGLAAQSRPVLASVAASLAFLYHAPTSVPFWFCFVPVLIWKRQWRVLIPLLLAIGLILLAAAFQPGVIERQHFFFRLDPDFEKLQRMRAPYNWVSLWAGSLMPQYLCFWTLSLVAFWRIRPQAGRVFLLALPLLGLLSVPLSYLLLERLRWGLIPQLQPARTLLFVTACTLILSAAAALRAAERRHWIEAALWFALAFIIPMQGQILNLSLRQWLLAAALAILCSLLPRKFLPVPLAAAYFLIPTLGQVLNYPHLETSELRQLAGFARDHTPANAMFVFPEAGHALYPGIFRVRALRPVYVDWKSGGQVNYYRSLAYEWWNRWQQFHALNGDPPDPATLRALGIDYVVMPADAKPLALQPVYHNGCFTVYRSGSSQ